LSTLLSRFGNSHSLAVREALTAEFDSDVFDLCWLLIENWKQYPRSIIYIAGNGGSASNASHLTLHLADAGYPAVDLTSRIPLLTALSNDYSYSESLVQQLGTLYEGDVIFVLSGSGNSANLISLVTAKYDGSLSPAYDNIKTVGLLGATGGLLKKNCDRTVCVDSNDYGVIEDCHSIAIHAIHKCLMGYRNKSIRLASQEVVD
jgi:D-sedoheptulose 7-phosphate isomerase